MNQFGFAHLPFAMANQQNPMQSLAQPGQPGAMGGVMGPRSGVNAFLGNNPQSQQLAQQIQGNPFMTTQGTTVPQNMWQGNQFTMPALPTITTPTPAPAAPTPTAPAAAMTGPNAPIWTQGMFTPIGAKKTGYRQPDVPVPPGYRWDASLGYFAPRDYTDEGE